MLVFPCHSEAFLACRREQNFQPRQRRILLLINAQKYLMSFPYHIYIFKMHLFGTSSLFDFDASVLPEERPKITVKRAGENSTGSRATPNVPLCGPLEASATAFQWFVMQVILANVIAIAPDQRSVVGRRCVLAPGPVLLGRVRSSILCVQYLCGVGQWIARFYMAKSNNLTFLRNLQEATEADRAFQQEGRNAAKVQKREIFLRKQHKAMVQLLTVPRSDQQRNLQQILQHRAGTLLMRT
ncbi:hypothetical protein BJ742DRAFT_911879 [Cladochytrium replicatum]|nr:hypothetical protein BJ742DRAFT_911879 [Cladochytrium replicatum]